MCIMCEVQICLVIIVLFFIKKKKKKKKNKMNPNLLTYFFYYVTLNTHKFLFGLSTITNHSPKRFHEAFLVHTSMYYTSYRNTIFPLLNDVSTFKVYSGQTWLQVLVITLKMNKIHIAKTLFAIPLGVFGMFCDCGSFWTFAILFCI